MVKTLYDLAYQIDQNVFIPYGSEPVCTRSYRETIAVVFVMPDTTIRLLRQTEHRVLHTMPIILERPIENVRDKKIARWVTIGKQRGAPIDLCGDFLLF